MNPRKSAFQYSLSLTYSMPLSLFVSHTLSLSIYSSLVTFLLVFLASLPSLLSLPLSLFNTVRPSISLSLSLSFNIFPSFQSLNISLTQPTTHRVFLGISGGQKKKKRKRSEKKEKRQECHFLKIDEIETEQDQKIPFKNRFGRKKTSVLFQNHKKFATLSEPKKL